MNLVLLFPEDFITGTTVRLTDRRLDHIRLVHRAEVGDRLRVGLLDGLAGHGIVAGISNVCVELEVELNELPPAPLDITLLLALPRPKCLRKVLQSVAAMGVKTIYIMRTRRVEKSYWSSPHLSPESIRKYLLLGLEQGCDTVLPRVEKRLLFRPFVEDEVPNLTKNKKCYVAHPSADKSFPRQPSSHSKVVAIGPEGGFVQFELDLFAAQGFTPASFGPRPLRVEDAVVVTISRLCSACPTTPRNAR